MAEDGFMFTRDKIKAFQFGDPDTQREWVDEVDHAWEFMLNEVKVATLEPIEDNVEKLRARLLLFGHYLVRLAYCRARLEQFYSTAYSLRLGEQAGKGKSMTEAKAETDKQVACVAYLHALAERLFESLKEGKSAMQSVLAMEREGMQPHTLYENPNNRRPAGVVN
jgi:hypothetical protein